LNMRYVREGSWYELIPEYVFTAACLGFSALGLALTPPLRMRVFFVVPVGLSLYLVAGQYNSFVTIFPNSRSRQDLLHHVPMHVGEAMVAALVAERQAAMVDAQAVQHGRVQVVHVHGVLGDVVREVVRGAVRVALLDAAAGQPDREAARVMVTAVVLGGQRT